MKKKNKIILLRHGEPDISIPKRIASNELVGFVVEYDAVGIVTSSIPSQEAIDQANQASIIVCSTLQRSLESAQKLTKQPVFLTDALFCEANLPYSDWHYPRLSPLFWLTFYRVLWLLGYSKNAESFKAAKARAKQAAQLLVALANQHQRVLLVGHGVINYLIDKELKKLGWKSNKKSPRKYWHYSLYHC